MTQTTIGQVYKVFEKSFPGKGGKPGATWFSIKLEGNDTYFRCKANKPAVSPGQTVKISHGPIDGTNADVLSAPEVVTAPAPEASKAGSAAVGGGAGVGLGQAREASIHYQSARKDALQMVDIITRTGAVKLPAKEAAKLEALEALVDSFTSRFFSDISTFGAVARANGTDGAETTAATQTAEDDE